MSAQAFVICGLGFGDEGKGTITDFLARECGASMVVRYNGGPQAGHNVITPDGIWHCFAQFGSGTFASSSPETHLSNHMFIEPEALAVEAEVLNTKGVADVHERLFISDECAIITPMHKMIGRMKEIARSAQAHGSCGMGVGQAIFWKEDGISLSVSDVLKGRTYTALCRLKEYAFSHVESLFSQYPSDEIEDTIRYFRERCNSGKLTACYNAIFSSSGFRFTSRHEFFEKISGGDKIVIFEGAQGALLDRTRGFVPFVTKSNATAENALSLLAQANIPLDRIAKIGVLRAYGHRHGAGPFVTEDPLLKPYFDDRLNPENRWQGTFRVGWLDRVALRYGIAMNGAIDSLALTNLDRLSAISKIKVCISYEYRGDCSALDRFFEWEPIGDGHARIFGIRPTTIHHNDAELSTHLFRCRPLEWVECEGWTTPIQYARTIEDLPPQARAFIEFLESPQGFDLPISIVSVGPVSHQKIRKL